MVIEKFSSVSVAISGTARYQFVAAGTSRPKASSPIQHMIWASGPTFAGCSSFSTRRLKGVRSDDATGVPVLGRVELVVMVVLLGQTVSRAVSWNWVARARIASASRGRNRSRAPKAR